MTGTLPSAKSYARVLALVRILTGAMWLAHGVPKFIHSSDFMPGPGPVDCARAAQTQMAIITNYVCSGLQHTSGPYHDFLGSFVLPNISIVAEVVRLGEVLTGLALVLGALTRVGGLAGMLLTANYIAARGHALSSATLQSLDFCMFVLCGINLLLPTGRIWGVDALWSRRRMPPAPAPVRAEFVPEPPLDRPTAPPSP